MPTDKNHEVQEPPFPPRDLGWCGRVAASAFVLPTGSGWLNENEARHRILALWEPGATIYSLDEGWLVLLPKPRMVRAETGPGTPLVRVDGAGGALLSAAPVSPHDAKRLRSAHRDTVALTVHGGAWKATTLEAFRSVDPAAWLELGEVTIVPGVESLGAPPAPVVEALPAVRIDPRKAYGKVGPPASELNNFVAALRDLQAAGEKAQAAPPQGTVGNALGDTLARFAAKLRARIQPPTFERGDDSRTVRVAQPETPKNEPADPWEWLRWGVARLAGLTGLGALIGQKQAQYMQKMLDLFERGDLEEALRHAIPLGSDLDGLLKRLPPSLTAPMPRKDLTISPKATAASSSFGASSDLHSHLQTLYRQAFERLERANRIDEAAFVLAELLKQNEEAVGFLEKHNRLALAADMAEARGLPDGWIIRLRFLAGGRDRAIAYARRTGAWADAVMRLERIPERAQEARALRLEWAASLARGGAYGQAIDVALPVAEARNLVRAWMGRIVESGGVPAARMRARRLASFAEDSDSNERAEALALLSGEADGAALERRAFIEEITRPNTWTATASLPVQRALARAAVRTLARDTATGVLPPPADTLYQALLQTIADPVLKADAPPLREIAGNAPATVRHRALRDRSPEDAPFAVEAHDTGLLPVHDAAHLPSGRTLVALGETGVRLLAPDGHVLRDWGTVPAHRLVPADSGNMAVALARRGSLWHLTRLDLVTGTATPWCDVEIPVFAPDSDGSLWMVALPNGGGTQALVALDLQGPPDRLASLWRTPLEQGDFVSIARSSSACAALSLHNERRHVASDNFFLTWNWQRWQFEIPSLVMRDRYLWATTTVQEERAGWGGIVNASGISVLRKLTITSGAMESPTENSLDLWKGRDIPPLSLTAHKDRRRGPHPIFKDDWLADIQYHTGDAPPIIALLSIADAGADKDPTRLRITLAGAGNVGARLFGDHLTVWDDQGRVLAFDLSTGDGSADLRVR